MQHRIADDIAAAIGDAVARFGSVKEDLDKQLKTIISNALDRLDLVTREEFDIQSQVLARTREKLKALEARVDALEKARSGS